MSARPGPSGGYHVSGIPTGIHQSPLGDSGYRQPDRVPGLLQPIQSRRSVKASFPLQINPGDTSG